jgi:GNAT superfamily N-acetyltransferase
MVTVRQASIADAAIIHRLLLEASAWVDALGPVMWEDGEVDFDVLNGEVAAGQFYVADVGTQAVGAVRFQTEDRLFWPDIPQESSAFVHRLVVSRAHKGTGVSTALLRWAAGHASLLGKTWLRLDCDDNRPKLKALYEAFGFRLHSYRQVGPYYVARYEYALERNGIDATQLA